MDKKYTEFTAIEDMATDVIKEHLVNLAEEIQEVKIVYLKTEPAISKTKIASCTKPGPLLKYFSEADFIIQVSGVVWDKIDDETRKIVLLHELKHIGISRNKDDQIVTRIVDHDFKDFSYIVKKYGTAWMDVVQGALDFAVEAGALKGTR